MILFCLRQKALEVVIGKVRQLVRKKRECLARVPRDMGIGNTTKGGGATVRMEGNAGEERSIDVSSIGGTIAKNLIIVEERNSLYATP